VVELRIAPAASRGVGNATNDEDKTKAVTLIILPLLYTIVSSNPNLQTATARS